MARDRDQRNDPHDSLANIHLDVHHIRQDIRAAIEKSQTAVMNRLSLLEAKIDRLAPPSGGEVITDEDKALMAESLRRLKLVSDRTKEISDRI